MSYDWVHPQDEIISIIQAFAGIFDLDYFRMAPLATLNAMTVYMLELIPISYG